MFRQWSAGVTRVMNCILLGEFFGSCIECSFPFSQQPATCPYKEPDESIRFPAILFIYEGKVIPLEARCGPEGG